MSQGRRLIPRIAGFIAAGAAGGAAAIGAVSAAGGLGSTTTVEEVPQQAPPPGQVALDRSSRTALTVAQLYARAAPGVVQITSTTVVQPPADPFFGDLFQPAPETTQSLGSGFVLDKAGHVVTNYHVVQGARTVLVSFSNNDRMRAKIVGTDPSTDLAVLQVDTRSRALEPLPLGNSDLVRVGDPVVAIGNPFGYTRTATSGIVSAVQREIQSPNAYAIDHVIQTDAALNKGNSGGPLLNAAGQVIGVNSQIATGDSGADGNVGIGFAVPVNTVKQVAAQLIAGGRVEHAYLGVRYDTVDARLARVFNLPVRHGLLVESVAPHSPAAAAGLHGGSTPVVVSGESYVLGGDVIEKVDGAALTTDEGLRDVLDRKRPGDRITLEVLRGSTQVTVTAKLGRQPTSPRS
ncbi:MAG TPA: trypsin-like peptidase domain-containing protein [Gaiellaceae bacterium]|nr:trypsin-like peptidase domain-containing protein [Gaiellaceae bacterium]